MNIFWYCGRLNQGYMKKITFKKLNNAWQLSFGSSIVKRKNVAVLYYRLKRKISRWLASCEGVKTCVRVNYGNGYYNESLPSKDESYLLYCAGCFLEDFLSENMLKKIEKKYGQEARTVNGYSKTN